MTGIESVLERNRTFAAAGGHEGAVVFPELRLFVEVAPNVGLARPRTTPFATATPTGPALVETVIPA